MLCPSSNLCRRPPDIVEPWVLEMRMRGRSGTTKQLREKYITCFCLRGAPCTYVYCFMTHTEKNIYIHIYLNIHTYTQVYLYSHTYVHMNVHIRTYAYINIYKCIYTYVHIHRGGKVRKAIVYIYIYTCRIMCT